MKIKFLGNETKVMRWRGSELQQVFSPSARYAEIPDDLGKRLLANPEVTGMFEEYIQKQSICSECGETFSNQGSLNLHSRTHKKKEKQREKVNRTRRPAFGNKPDVGSNEGGITLEPGSDLNRQDLSETQLH